MPRTAERPGRARAAARGRELAALKRLYERHELRGEIVYRTMRAAIIREIFGGGERLQDRVLAQMLGVSRTPVREALQRLASEGFVENVPRLGLVVAEITSQDIEDIYVMRIALEGLAARLAAERASTSEIEAMTALNEQIAEATERGDVAAMTALNKRFHETIYGAARNPRLANLLDTFHDAVQRFRWSTLSVPERARETIEEHRQVVEAIRTRNAAEAERLARLHKERAKSVRLALYGQQRHS
jgi:DNA-binding GntR family transcriptional regulator